MTTKTTYNYMITTTLLIIATLLIQSCNKPTEPHDSKTETWQKIADLEGVDVFDVKIHNNEIYIAGRDLNGKGVIYRSSDAINWEVFNPSIGDSLDWGVGAIDFYNGNLIACFTGKPVYIVMTDKISPLTKPILNDVREMIVDNNGNILIGTTGESYHLKYATKDSILNIYDSLSTPSTGGCYRQTAIVPIAVSKFLMSASHDNILIGNYSFNNHFVTVFGNAMIDCFPTEGLDQNEKYFGCHDIIYIDDTLFAAGYASIKYLNQNEWKTYGDTLPKTPDSVLTIATSIAYDEIKNEIYVAANYIGVVKWVKNSGWTKLNNGLESFQGYYDFISDIVYFKGKLLLTYGKSKNYKSTYSGAMVFL